MKGKKLKSDVSQLKLRTVQINELLTRDYKSVSCRVRQADSMKKGKKVSFDGGKSPKN